MSYEPLGNGPNESRAEEVIGWYQHYMGVEIDHLREEYEYYAENDDQPEPSYSLKAAAANRLNEQELQ